MEVPELVARFENETLKEPILKNLSAALALAITVIAFGAAPQAHASACFQQYENAILECSSKDGVTQYLCNLDAAVDLTACVRHTIF